ncbi:MAG: repeat-associated core domain protein [Acidobacteriaceae bacterium]|nr:repeat-associated core domain protein [Acidobacteriaceae bacterium]
MQVLSRAKVRILVVLLLLLGLGSRAYASSSGSMTFTGIEQYLSSSNAWDSGTISVSVNYHTESVTLGQFSTVDSIASAIAAKFSCDCGGPVNARSAPGGIIYFQMRGGAELTQLSATLSSTASFSWSANSMLTPTVATATIGSNYLQPGQSTPVDVQVNCGNNCGQVDFRIDSGELSTVSLDNYGHAQVSTSGASPGLHNIVVKYLGGSGYLPSSSNAVSFTLASTASNPSNPPLYSYSLGYFTNRNISASVDSVNGNWQDIGYDGMNRLTAARYIPNGGSNNYMCWGYDAFGNRLSQSNSSSLPCQPSGLSADTWAQYNANNQVVGTPQLAAFPTDTYDGGGNPNLDGVHQFLYDAEGRICASSGPLGIIQYIYDAEGRRVARGTNSSWTCDTSNFSEIAGYILGPGGEQVTEVGPTGNWLHTNAYAGGQLLATYDPQGLHFHLSDWLGSRRVQTDYAGNPEQNYLNLPFGETITNAINSTPDATEHHFTDKERDTESGLDYFGARYYASTMGRFMSPDDDSGQDEYQPQSWNLYSYVQNNPIARIDPDGHDCIDTSNLQKDGTATVTSGTSCANDPAKYGTYVDGTVDTKSLTVNSKGDLGYSYSNYADGSGSAGAGVITQTPDGMAGSWLAQGVFHGAGQSKWGPAANVVNAAGSAVFSELIPLMPELLLGTLPEVGLGIGGVGAARTGSTVLYEKIGANGEHLKYGITNNPATRYSPGQLAGGRLKILARGSRSEMLRLERSLHEALPIGPEEGQGFYVNKQVGNGLKPPPY